MVSAIFKSYGLDSLRLLQVRFSVCKKKKPSAFAELFSMVQQMKPNLNQKCLLP